MRQQPRILIAHVDDVTRALLGHVLEQKGYEPVHAASTHQAYELAQTKSFDLLIVHWDLCNRTALPLVPALRKVKRTQTTPILVLGRPQSKEDLRLIIKQGVQAVMVTTAFDVGAFLSKVENALAQVVPTPEEKAERQRSRASARQARVALEVAGAMRNMVSKPLPRVTKVSPAALATNVPPVRDLPIFEFTYRALSELTHSESASSEDLAAVVMRDPFCVLHLLNHAHDEAFLRGRTPFIKPVETIAAMGRDAFGAFCESLQSRPIDRHPLTDREGLVHAIASSRLASQLAVKMSVSDPTLAAVAAMTYDLGHWLLKQGFGEQLDVLHTAQLPMGMDECEAQRRVLGVSRVDAAVQWSSKWNLPYPLSNWARYHCTPDADPTFPRGEAQLALVIARTASVVIGHMLGLRDRIGMVSNLPATFTQLAADQKLNGETTYEAAVQAIANVRQEIDSAAGLEPVPPRQVDNRHKLVYACLKAPPLDPVAIAAQGHVRQFFRMDLSALEQAAMGVPWVINLIHVPSNDAINRVVARLLKVGTGKPAMLLLPDPCDPEVLSLASHLNWPITTLPMATATLHAMLDDLQHRAAKGSHSSAA